MRALRLGFVLVALVCGLANAASADKVLTMAVRSARDGQERTLTARID